MNVRFLTIAEQEVDEAHRWFEDRTEGMGLQFLDELHRAVNRINSFPFAALEVEPEIRRSVLARFPYTIVYGIDDQTIIVIAVAHMHREPRYWIGRAEA